ncbi:hypothetical protein TPELB_19840 [Terrisporobacter petrolearius]|uniref:DUF4367 domain-containing protein n=2 Tax=Terrisporobacter TaxID=1505652 RepID=A0ABZ3FEP2_9FIRM
MKKKRIIISIVIIIVSAISILLYPYINKYKDYKEVKLKNVGAIKVPKEWKCFKTEKGLLYFADKPIKEKGSNVYLIQYELISNDTLYENEEDFDENEGDDKGYYFENYDLGDDISVKNVFIPPFKYPETESCTFPNSTTYSTCTFELNGKIINNYLICFEGDDYNTTFLVANKSVDKETMEKISKSFDMTK